GRSSTTSGRRSWTRRCHRCTRTWATSRTGAAITTEQCSTTSVHSRSTPASVTTYTPSSATSTTSSATGMKRCGAGGSHSRSTRETMSSGTTWRRWRMWPGSMPPGLGALPLAHGDLGEADAQELQALKLQVQADSGLRCNGYKEKCLRRRIAVRMRARGVHRYSDYAALLRADPAEYEPLLSAIVINVSKFFRNPEVWTALRERVVPALLERGVKPLRIWSAGTAGGEEAYSAAILLIEALGQAEESVRRRVEVLGTDIDEES